MHPTDDPTPTDDAALRETLKRCTPATYYAACKYRATGDPAALQSVIDGVIERFVDRDLRAKLAGPASTQPALRLREDLGLDSLTMMEVIMVAEEVLPLTISNEELTKLQTLGQVHDFIAAKLAAGKPVAPAVASAPAPRTRPTASTPRPRVRRARVKVPITTPQSSESG